MKEDPKSWKMVTGAILAILGAVYGVYSGTTTLPEGAMAIGAAFSVIGASHRFDKFIALSKKLALDSIKK